jgi:general secretion pathway protein E
MSLAEDIATDQTTPPAVSLAYGFARRRGAMILRGGDRPVCLHRRSATLETLLEVRRVNGDDIAFEAVDDERFDALLREQTGSEATPASDYAASEDDLAALAEDAAAVDDLLLDANGAPPDVLYVTGGASD